MKWRRRGGFEHLLSCLDLPHSTQQVGSRPLRVLEAGCGGGGEALEFLATQATDTLELYGFDVVDTSTCVTRMAAVKSAQPWKSRIRTASCPDQWPFPDGHFDVVFSHHVIEHVRDLDAFMAEHRRVLRPGGRGVHVFPSSRLVVEPHLDAPFAHWPRGDTGRRRVLRVLERLSIGNAWWREQGLDAQVAYLRGSTYFRTHGEVSEAIRASGLQVEPGHSLNYAASLVRALRDGPSVPSATCGNTSPYARRHLRRASTSLGQWLVPVTLLVRAAGPKS